MLCQNIKNKDILVFVFIIIFPTVSSMFCQMRSTMMKNYISPPCQLEPKSRSKPPIMVKQSQRQSGGGTLTRAFGRSPEAAPSVAVVGGGFAGLGTAYHLLCLGAQVAIFDPQPVGTGGASAVAAGILHPLTPRGKLTWKGAEGFAATQELVGHAEQALSQAGLESCITCKSVLRPLYTEKHQKMFSEAAKILPEWVQEVTANEYKKMIGETSSKFPALGAVLISGAIGLSSSQYLKGLWLACQSMGNATWIHEKVESLSDLDKKTMGFDSVVVAAGSGTLDIRGFENPMGLKLVRGQTLLFDNREVNLEHSILCGDYLMPKGNMVIAGATSEYGRSDAVTDPAFAETELRPKLERLLPRLAGLKPVDCQAGVRVFSKRNGFGKLPVINKINIQTERSVTTGDGDNQIKLNGNRTVWLFSALGARGLIHHALIGKYLAHCIRWNDSTSLPRELLEK